MEKKVKKTEAKKVSWIWVAFSVVFTLIFFLKGFIIKVLEWIIDLLDWALRNLSLPLAIVCLGIFFYPFYSPQLKVWWKNWRKR
jgi:membrane protein YdbS with pleckstrin-like domain